MGIGFFQNVDYVRINRIRGRIRRLVFIEFKNLEFYYISPIMGLRGGGVYIYNNMNKVQYKT